MTSHSILHCENCRAALETWSALHFCSACGAVQSVDSKMSYFRCFGFEPRFGLDASTLEKRFFEISKVLHPDRFTIAEPKIKQLSLEKMSLLNLAYGTLKNPESRRVYLLDLLTRSGEVEVKNSKQKIPAELAESWFEIQDLLVEDREKAVLKVKDFEKEIHEYRNRLEAKIRVDEKACDDFLDQGASRTSGLGAILVLIDENVQALRYLASLIRDVERIKSYAHPN